MRKVLLFAVPVVITFFFCLKFFRPRPAKPINDTVSTRDAGRRLSEWEDGIKEAQQQDFEATKDVRLGYVPKDRLVKAYMELMSARQQQASNRLAISGTSVASGATAFTWTERGPNTDIAGSYNSNPRPGNGATSGRIRAIWVDLADATRKTVWVGGVDGGLWKTTDITVSPANWTVVNDFFGNLAIGSICQDPTNTNTMYFGTGEKTFNADRVRGGGIWKSTDHGVTWNLLSATTGFWNVSKILCDKSGNVYVATIGNNQGLLRSTDGGTTWTNITPSTAGGGNQMPEMVLSSAGRMHVVKGYYNSPNNQSGYFYTDNPATVTSSTWTSPVTSFKPLGFNCALACAGNTLYALPSDSNSYSLAVKNYQTPAIYKSTDGGANWAATATAPPAASGNNDLSIGQAWYNLAIAVDTLNPQNVIVGGLNCYKTTDGGASWSQISVWLGGISSTVTNYVHADQQAATWNGSQVLMASDGGIFYSGDAGATFTDRNTGLRIKQFYSCAVHPSSTNYFLAGAQDNGVHQFTNVGLSGTTEVTGGDGAFVQIDQDQPQYQFGSYVFNTYRRSLDGGTNWAYIDYATNVGRFINATDYDDANNIMYAGGNGNQYIRWDDPQTGATFTPVTLATSGALVTSIKVSPYTSNRVFMGTGGGHIYRLDNANTASPASTDITGTGMSASTVSCVNTGTNDNNLIASFSNYGSRHVWVTTTGGGSSGWTEITGNLPDIPVRWAIFYPEDNTRAILATEMGVYTTAAINGASTVWTQESTFPVVRTDMLKYRKSDGTIAAATHGRGLWTAVQPFSQPYIRFAPPSAYITVKETTAATSGCRGYKDYTLNMSIDMAPVGDATVTLNVAGGTATRGIDYDFTTNGNFTTPSGTLTFTNGITASLPITIRIYDDADIEPTESFTLGYTVSGTTNAVAAPSNPSYTYYINSNGAAPVLPGAGSGSIGTGNYTNGFVQPFRGDYQGAKSQYIYLASELKAAGFSAGNITALGLNILNQNSYNPYQGLTISLKNTTTTAFNSLSPAFENGATQCYSGSPLTLTGVNTFTFTTPFNWDGTSNLLVEVCYNSTSAPLGSDYVSSHTTTDDKGIWNYSNTGNGCNLSAVYSGVSGAFIRPDIVLTGNRTGNPVATVLNSSGNAYLAPSHDIYYYDANGNIMARITSLSAFDYGCTSVTIDRAGTGTTAFWNNTPANYLMNKTFRVVPTTNNTAGQYTITLYYTAAEVAGWKAATGQSWGNIQLVKVQGQISQVTPSTPNAAGTVTAVTPTHGSYGNDSTLSYTFSNGFSGFGAGIVGTALPVILLDFNGRLVNGAVGLTWSTSSEWNTDYFELQKSSDGAAFYPLGRVTAAGYSSGQLNYAYTDRQVNEFNYYRLKTLDRDGRFTMSKTVLVRNENAVQQVRIMNNPFRSFIEIHFAKIPQRPVQFELLNTAGALVYRVQRPRAGEIRLDLSSAGIAGGVYVLRTTVDGHSFTNRVVKQ